MRTIRLSVGLTTAVLLTSCVVVENGSPALTRSPVQPPQLCAQNYDPVCAKRGNLRSTFPNACEAAANSFQVIHPGQCGDDGGPRPLPGRPDPNESPPGRPLPGGAVACLLIETPVCGSDGQAIQTFANSCIAEASGFRVVHDGPCG